MTGQELLQWEDLKKLDVLQCFCKHQTVVYYWIVVLMLQHQTIKMHFLIWMLLNFPLRNWMQSLFLTPTWTIVDLYLIFSITDMMGQFIVQPQLEIWQHFYSSIIWILLTGKVILYHLHQNMWNKQLKILLPWIMEK